MATRENAGKEEKMEFTEKEVYEAMGMEAPEEAPAAEPTGGNGQGVAAPAAEETGGAPGSAGAEQTGDANGAGPKPEEKSAETPAAAAGEAPDAENTDNGAPDGGGEGEAPAAQTEAQRHEHAAARRRAEQRAAIDEALGRERERTAQEWKDFFAAAGLKNTVTGQPITSKAEFDEWSKAHAQDKLQHELELGRLTPEGLETAISANPIVQQAQEIIRAHEEERRAAEQERMQREIGSQIAEIHKLEPEINGVEDLLKLPEAEQFYAAVKGGRSFLDAYYLVTRERREARIAEDARNQALAADRSKDHLTPMGAGRGAGGKIVTSEEIAEFRVFNPDASDEEIRTWIEKNRT